jgi:hypothetical protein
LKPKPIKKSLFKTPATHLWPWFSFIFIILGFVLPSTTSAAASCSTQFVNNAQICNGLTVSITDSQNNPISQAKIGDTVNVKMTITDPNITGGGGNTFSYSIGICANASALPSCANLANFPAGAGQYSLTVPLTIDGTKFNNSQPNFNYTIGAAAQSSQVNNVVSSYGGSVTSGLIYEVGTTNLAVSAATNNGSPSLQISQTSQGTQGSASSYTVVDLFNLVYSDGGTGNIPSNLTYNCGGGTGSPSSPLAISATSKGSNGVTSATVSFSCSFPSSPQTYTVSGNAIGSNNSVLATANPSATVTITGNEINQGAQTITPTATSAFGLIGDGLTHLLNEVVAFVISLIQWIIFGLFAWLISPIIVAVLGIHPYQDTFVAVIYPGWETIRNLCDIFFIVALIIIAMATLFRVESYKARHLLVQLIIAALLINFSLVIGQAILAVADTAQAQFLPASIASVNLLGKQLMTTNNSYITNFITSQQNANASSVNSSFGGFIASIFWLAMSLGSFCVFCAIAAFLVIRIVALWILLMISPVAYAVGVLPSTAHYRDEWWKNFLKYAFFTPIMAFFLNMAGIMVSNATVNTQLQITANNSGVFTTAGFSALVVNLGSNILLIVFLIASLKVAEMAGIYGAEGITKLARQGITLPFKGAKALAGRGFEGVQNVTGVTMDPREWASAWKKYSEEQKAKRKDIRAGKKTLGLNLGSPQDMFKNYANMAAVKRMGRNIATKGRLKDLKNQYEDLAKKGVLMSDNERAEQLNRKRDLEANKSTLDANIAANEAAITKAKADSQRASDEISKLTAARADLGTEKANLKTAGKDTSAVDAEIAANDRARADLAKDKAKADAQLATLTAENTDNKEQSGRLRAQIQKITDGIASDDAKRSAANVTSFSGEEKERVKKSLQEFRNLSAQHKSPEAYYAREARLHLESEEAKKIADIEDEGELNALLSDAINQKDQHKATAILKKLTKDVNLNEALEDAGKASSYQGFKDFMEHDFADKIGIDHHELMQIATEIGYIAEGTKQYNFARPTTIDPKTNHIGWQKTQKDHDDNVTIQMRKSDPRAAAGTTTRFSVVDEYEEGGQRKSRLNNVGIAHILRYANPATMRHIAQFNTYTLEAAVKDPKWREDLLKGAAANGVNEDQVRLLIKEIEKTMASKAS